VKRDELIRMFILNGIADDYENLEHITKTVVALGVKCGLRIDSSEIWHELANLIEAGLAKAYRLLKTPPEEIKGIPSSEDLDDFYCYFWITDQGIYHAALCGLIRSLISAPRASSASSSS